MGRRIKISHLALVIIVVLACCRGLYAQENTHIVFKITNIFDTELNTNNQLMYTDNINLVCGYRFNNLLVAGIQVERATALFKIDNQKIWAANYAVGPTVGINLLRLNDKRMLRATVSAATSLLDNEWKYWHYDLGTEAIINNLIFGVGLRYYDSCCSMMNNRWAVSATIGFYI